MTAVSEPSRAFLTLSAAGVVVGNLLAIVAPLAGSPPRAFLGSVVTSGVFGLVFTVRTLQLLRATETVPLPAATLSTVFGGWFMIAPVLYGTDAVGFVATAGTQFGGLVTSAFGTYLIVAGLTAGRSD